MSYNYNITRRKTRVVNVGKVLVGGDNPITVQSMTNTKTTDIKATITQVKALEAAGADMVRISCPDRESANSLRDIVKEVDVPIIADIHFHYRRAIEAAEAGAACLRINPGNIGSKEKVMEVIRAAKDYNCSIRVGVNAGSLEGYLIDKYKSPTAEAMLESALNHIKILEDCDFFNFKISVKASNVFLARAAYELLAQNCDYPLHLGITESGSFRSGTVASAIGLGSLLWQGIGDTIRVSLSSDPVDEIKVGFDILKALNIRSRGVKIISCPSCARQGFDVIKFVTEVEERLSQIIVPLNISILGCVVNGIGEAQHTDIGIVGIGGTDDMGKNNHIYIDGSIKYKVSNEELMDFVVKLAEEKAQEKEKDQAEIKRKNESIK